jgi:transposase-like protein
MSIRRELIDELLKDYPNPQDVLAEDGLLKQLTKAVIERCLETELDTHIAGTWSRSSPASKFARIAIFGWSPP